MTAQFSPDALAKLAQHPLYAPSPSANAQLRVVTHGEPLAIPIRYFFFRDVLAELVRSFAADPRRAVCALLGSFRVDEGGPYVEVSGFESLLYLEDGQSPDLLLQGALDGLMAQPGDGAASIVVGWAAHMPGDQAALTEQAVHTHMTLFNVPLQLALLADLSSDRIACYARLPRGRFINPPVLLTDVV